MNSNKVKRKHAEICLALFLIGRFANAVNMWIMRHNRWYNRMLGAAVGMMTLFMLDGCDIIDIHPYDGKIDGDTYINARNIERIEQVTDGKAEIRFAFISDTQRWYDETEDEVADINSRSDIDFVIHGGDLTDFGVTKEFEWQQRILNKLKVPYVVLLGNHDCIGSGKSVFRTMFGNENFSFVAGPTRFVCLDTNALEFDFSNPVPDLSFLRSFRGDMRSKNTIVAMHVGPYSDEFDDNVANAFEYEVVNLKNTLCCIYGHGHATEQHEFFGDGMIYYQITCAKNRQYYIFTVNETGYQYETIDF